MRASLARSRQGAVGTYSSCKKFVLRGEGAVCTCAHLPRAAIMVAVAADAGGDGGRRLLPERAAPSGRACSDEGAPHEAEEPLGVEPRLHAGDAPALGEE